MDSITGNSPKRLIVLDCVEEVVKKLLGDNYSYRICVSDLDSLELIKKIDKPICSFILGDERSDLYDLSGTIENEVLIGVSIIKPVESNHLVNVIDVIEDIEKIKNKIVGNDYEHKGNMINGSFQSKEFNNASSSHDIDYSFGNGIFRCLFWVLLRIYTERN